jgi:hypothetical protein
MAVDIIEKSSVVMWKTLGSVDGLPRMILTSAMPAVSIATLLGVKNSGGSG